MGTNSKIEWTDHTFNPWMGCTKVSPGCRDCYAETLMAKRYGKVQWGPQAERKRTAKSNWKKPLTWNKEHWRECLACGFRGKVGLGEPFYMCRCGSRETKPTRQRVFCASLADVFEANVDLLGWRIELIEMIYATENLDWLILTKRPENITRFWRAMLPDNVWIGTSVENQKTADQRIAALVSVPAKTHFLSVEPLLERVDLQLEGRNYGRDFATWSERVQWVICGGESGPTARPMAPDWARLVRDQCLDANIPFLFKQWGEWGPLNVAEIPAGTTFKHQPVRMNNDLMYKVGKEKAGRVLDGRTWNEMPSTDCITGFDAE